MESTADKEGEEEEGQVGDFPGATLSEADKMKYSAYYDPSHQ